MAEVIQIVESIVEEAAGPSYSVKRLAEALSDAGQDSKIFSLSNAREVDSSVSSLNTTFKRDYSRIPALSKLGYSKDFKKAMILAAERGAVLHVHGLWRMPNIYPGHAARRARSPLVISPRGMLGDAALSFSAYSKKFFWTLRQADALKPTSCFHATSYAELDDIRSAGLTAPVAIIPNGIDIPPFQLKNGDRARRTVLCLGRIHPKKGIERLIHAWAKIEAENVDWQLHIVGPSEKGHTEELKSVVASLGLSRVFFKGAIYGNEKQDAYASADLFVLPTRHENFGMVVAEALAHGTPVICTKGAPWEGMEREGCGWWVDHNPNDIAAALTEAMDHPIQKLSEMGMKGRKWMERDFSWNNVAADMAAVYDWCRGDAEKPEFVYL
ncbi:hypothetical protein B6V75_18225 [Thioclava sp. F1Mire-8]|uniref:glycosyltransferase n=1 Tax=Thioclava sp. F1Mire-8 TaxID=1973006 RepID=UPI000B543152|nr:glycosyltransferase [Thioclava sp. F1Mire-8]OWX99683.1 hypothetical protein B6V75_18225 [Thioclava sp. F1Mire-8]